MLAAFSKSSHQSESIASHHSTDPGFTTYSGAGARGEFPISVPFELIVPFAPIALFVTLQRFAMRGVKFVTVWSVFRIQAAVTYGRITVALSIAWAL